MNHTPTEAERVARLAAELAELGRRLAWARHELLSLPIAGRVARRFQSLRGWLGQPDLEICAIDQF